VGAVDQSLLIFWVILISFGDLMNQQQQSLEGAELVHQLWMFLHLVWILDVVELALR
jgi:hypothetical protein